MITLLLGRISVSLFTGRGQLARGRARPLTLGTRWPGHPGISKSKGRSHICKDDDALHMLTLILTHFHLKKNLTFLSTIQFVLIGDQSIVLFNFETLGDSSTDTVMETFFNSRVQYPSRQSVRV
jgi:hypothetical protein